MILESFILSLALTTQFDTVCQQAGYVTDIDHFPSRARVERAGRRLRLRVYTELCEGDLVRVEDQETWVEIQSLDGIRHKITSTHSPFHITVSEASNTVEANVLLLLRDMISRQFAVGLMDMQTRGNDEESDILLAYASASNRFVFDAQSNHPIIIPWLGEAESYEVHLNHIPLPVRRAETGYWFVHLAPEQLGSLDQSLDVTLRSNTGEERTITLQFRTGGMFAEDEDPFIRSAGILSHYGEEGALEALRGIRSKNSDIADAFFIAVLTGAF